MTASLPRIRMLCRAVLFVTALAPLWWFHAGLPAKTVDSFFSLHPQGQTFSGLSAWDARSSTGVASSKMPATLLDAASGVLAAVGVPLVLQEALLLCVLAAAALFGMRAFILAVLDDGRLSEIAATCAAIVWLANPFALSFVWYHQLLIEITWAILPWLLVLAVGSARGTLPVRRWVSATLLLVVLAAPGLPHAYLLSVALIMVATLAGVVLSLKPWLPALQRAVLYVITVGIGISWWLVPSLQFLRAFEAEARTGGATPAQQLAFASASAGLQNVLSLTAIPQLYQSVDATPYIPWSWMVTAFPGSLLRFVLPLVALVGFVYGLRRRGLRPLSCTLALSLIVGSFVSKGMNAPFPAANELLSRLPFGDAFRHPVDKLALTVAFPLVVFFALGIVALARQRRLRMPAAIAALIVCIWLPSPWWTANVLSTGGGLLPSAFAEMPSGYDSLGARLDAQPVGGKTVALPFSPYGETAYAWPSGVQPNLDCILGDWAPRRSFMCYDAGSMLSDRVTNTLAAGVRARDPRVFQLARLWGVDSWVLHKDWRSDYMHSSDDPESDAAFLMNVKNEDPSPELTGGAHSYRLDDGIRSLILPFKVNGVLQAPISIATIGSIRIQVNPANDGRPYVGMTKAGSSQWLAGDPLSIGQWHELRVSWRGARVTSSIDGIPQSQLFNCTPACLPIDGHSLEIDSLPRSLRTLASRSALFVLSRPIVATSASGDPLYAGAEIPAETISQAVTAETPTLLMDVRITPRAERRTTVAMLGGNALRVVALRIAGRAWIRLERPSTNESMTSAEFAVGRWHRIAIGILDDRLRMAVDGRSGESKTMCINAARVLCSLSGAVLTTVRSPSIDVRGPGLYGEPREPAQTHGMPRLAWSDSNLAFLTQAAVPLVFAASAVVSDARPFGTASALDDAARAPSSGAPAVLFGKTVPRLAPGASTTWDWVQPWELRGRLNARGNVLLVFAQTFDPGWELTINGSVPIGARHIVVDGAFNGWIIDVSGPVRWQLYYGPERAAIYGFCIGLVLAAAAVLAALPAKRRSEHGI